MSDLLKYIGINAVACGGGWLLAGPAGPVGCVAGLIGVNASRCGTETTSPPQPSPEETIDQYKTACKPQLDLYCSSKQSQNLRECGYHWPYRNDAQKNADYLIKINPGICFFFSKTASTVEIFGKEVDQICTENIIVNFNGSNKYPVHYSCVGSSR